MNISTKHMNISTKLFTLCSGLALLAPIGHAQETPKPSSRILDPKGFTSGDRKNLIWEDTFEAGGWRASKDSGSKGGTVAAAPEWAQSMNQGDYSAQAVKTVGETPVRDGQYAMRFEWRAENYKKGSNVSKKASLFTRKDPTSQEERWWGFSMYLPSKGMEADSKSEILAQWHETPDKGEPFRNPPLSLSNSNDELSVGWYYDTRKLTPQLAAEQKFDRQSRKIGKAPKDRWVDMVWHIKWDPFGKGLLQVWMDGKLVVNEKDIAIGTNDDIGTYTGVGIYKYTGASDHAKRIIYFDEVRGGNAKATYADVAPGNKRAPLATSK